MAKNQSLPAHLQEKDSKGEKNLTFYEHHEKPTIWWPRPSLSNPRSTNDIVWAFLRIVSLQLAPSVGKACVLAKTVGWESSVAVSNRWL